ncbi:MAG: hypothetical protein AAGG47_16880 [Pseudomonadota bacterium]
MPDLPDQAPDFPSFLNCLPGKTLALVYSFSNTIDKDRVWYDRWRSSTIMYFGQGGEELGLDVRYIDVDTFLREIARPGGLSNDYLINLHSGLRDISSWPIVSSMASWRGLPAGPCPSDVHITCERKDITRALARSLKFKLPEAWTPDHSKRGEFVIKARDLGMSVGLRKSSQSDELSTAHADPRLVVEEFIPGFDATIAVLANHVGGYTVLGAVYYEPKARDFEWMFTEDLKKLPLENDEFRSIGIAISDDLSTEVVKLSEQLGDGGVYRHDFRIEPLPNGEPPSVMTLDNSWYLEVTPTPTMAEQTDFGQIIKRAVSDDHIRLALTGRSERGFKGDRAAQSVLVACLLYKSVCRLHHYR